MDNDVNQAMPASCADIEEVNSVDFVVREDILAKAKELAETMGTSEEVKFYKTAESQLDKNERVQSLIKAIKKKQKEAVAFESFKNSQMVEKIEAEIDELQDELDNIPVVVEFKQTQNDINYLLQLVVGVLRDSLSEKIELDSESASSPDGQTLELNEIE